MDNSRCSNVNHFCLHNQVRDIFRCLSDEPVGQQIGLMDALEDFLHDWKAEHGLPRYGYSQIVSYVVKCRLLHLLKPLEFYM